MSSTLTEKEEAEVTKLFGEILGKEFIKMYSEIKERNELQTKVGDARFLTSQTKLDTIIDLLRNK